MVELDMYTRTGTEEIGVTVKLFASFREAVGDDALTVRVGPGTTIGDLWQRFVEEYPRLAPMRGVAGMALNGRYEAPEAPLSDGDVVAFLPPVSGG
jgi:molybdopterin synthase sulfur carrier subunit